MCGSTHNTAVLCAFLDIVFRHLFFLPSYAVSVCAVAGARLSLHMCSVCSTMVSAASMQVRAALASMGGEENATACNEMCYNQGHCAHTCYRQRPLALTPRDGHTASRQLPPAPSTLTWNPSPVNPPECAKNSSSVHIYSCRCCVCNEQLLKRVFVDYHVIT